MHQCLALSGFTFSQGEGNQSTYIILNLTPFIITRIITYTKHFCCLSPNVFYMQLFLEIYKGG